MKQGYRIEKFEAVYKRPITFWQLYFHYFLDYGLVTAVALACAVSGHPLFAFFITPGLVVLLVKLK